jgi:hypothetical protein
MERLTKEQSVPITSRGRPSQYPWDEWFTLTGDEEETTVRLEKGVDYTISSEHFRVVVVKAAERREGKASTRIEHDEDREFLRVTFRKQLNVEEDMWSADLIDQHRSPTQG